MPAVFSYRLRLARPLGGGRGAGRPGPARGRLRTAVLPVGAALAVFLTSGATAALADTPQGGVDVTVPIAMLSLTVAPTSVTLDNCSGGSSTAHALGFPHGSCSAGGITVTNTGAPSHVRVQGSDAVPSDNGKHWQLLAATTGLDQFDVQLNGPTGYVTQLYTLPTCDQAFNAGTCTASEGASTIESLGFFGPSATTDTSSSFTTTVTWIAVL